MIPTDPSGTPIANAPGAVVVRVYRVQGDGLTLVDIGGALVSPTLVARVDEITGSLAGVLGQEIVKAIALDVHGPPSAEDAPVPPPPPLDDPWTDFLKELDDDGKPDTTEPK